MMETKPYAKIRLDQQSLQRLRSILSAPQRWISLWFFAYALQGAVTSGLLPILIPLMIVALSHHLSTGLAEFYDWGLVPEDVRIGTKARIKRREAT